MFRVAIQIKELISSNVTHALDGASNPAKMLHKLQREIEEALISLEGERTKNDRKVSRLETALTQNELREADWGDKAKTAMDYKREDLARQALMAREDCRETIATLTDDLAKAKLDADEINAAITELDAKRSEIRERVRAQIAADVEKAAGEPGYENASMADKHLSRIATIEKRTDFATADQTEESEHANIDREINQMRRQSAIEAEIAAMKPKTSKKTPRKKSG